VIQVGAPPPGPRVHSGAAYLAYLGALALAFVLLAGAAGGPSAVTAWRRHRAAVNVRNPGRPSVGVVVGADHPVRAGAPGARGRSE
jgi:hypothetical protein